MARGAVPGSKKDGPAVSESLPPLKPGTASARVPGTKASVGYFTEGTDNSFYQAKPWSVRRPVTTMVTPGSYAAQRAVHRASQKGYTAGRMTLNPEPPATTNKITQSHRPEPLNIDLCQTTRSTTDLSQTMKVWVEGYRGADLLKIAGTPSGHTKGNSGWRSHLHLPNERLPQVAKEPPQQWRTSYSRDYSPKRERVSPWVDAGRDFNKHFDKVTVKHGAMKEADIMRPFMYTVMDKELKDLEIKTRQKFAGYDTAESKGWDGSMAFDAVYSERYTAKDTESQIVFG